MIPALCFYACSRQESKVQDRPPAYTNPDTNPVPVETVRSGIQFTDVTKNSGIDFIHETGAFGLKWMPETMGSGAGFFDYNNDGKIFVTY